MSENKDRKNTASISENSVLANSKRGFPFKKVFFAILVALVVISIILLVINIVINSYFSKVKVYDGEITINKELMDKMPIYKDNKAYFAKNESLHAAYDAALLNYAQASSDAREDENVFNYAIFGTDQYDGSKETASADIIMLASVNEEKDYVTYLSFETKMFVYIPGVGVGPMSDAYLLGGPQLLANTIEQNYGIKVNGFIDLNMSAFSQLIDLFGNVEFKADKAFVDELNEDIKLFNEAKKLTGDKAVKPATLKSGKVSLNGDQTLAYLRNASSEKSRIANDVLAQITEKIYEQGLGGAKTTLDIALEEMTVSLSRDDVGALVSIGTSVLGSVKAIPVGNMDGRTQISGGYTCNYAAERAAVVRMLYQ